MRVHARSGSRVSGCCKSSLTPDACRWLSRRTRARAKASDADATPRVHPLHCADAGSAPQPTVPARLASLPAEMFTALKCTKHLRITCAAYAERVGEMARRPWCVPRAPAIRGARTWERGPVAQRTGGTRRARLLICLILDVLAGVCCRELEQVRRPRRRKERLGSVNQPYDTWYQHRSRSYQLVPARFQLPSAPRTNAVSRPRGLNNARA